MLDTNWFMQKIMEFLRIDQGFNHWYQENLNIPVIDNDDALANGFLPNPSID